MPFSKKIFISIAMLASIATIASPVAFAEQKSKSKVTSSYNEDEFLRAFSGKSSKVIAEKLGAPAKKEQGVRPSSATGVVSQMGQSSDPSKPVNVEMWYYKNLVRYDPKKTYKETELTFVNGRCMNIAFFNNR